MDDFTEFVHAQWRPLVRTAVFLGCSLTDAEDVVQTTLMKAYRHWPRVRRADDPTAYAFRMLLNTMTRSRERRWNGERPTAQLPDSPVDDGTGLVDRRDELLRLLAGLSQDQRDVLVLRYVADLSEAQAAAVLGIAPGTVKSRAARGIAACQRQQEEAL